MGSLGYACDESSETTGGSGVTGVCDVSSETTGGSGVTGVSDVSSETTGVVRSLGYVMCPVKLLG